MTERTTSLGLPLVVTVGHELFAFAFALKGIGSMWGMGYAVWDDIKMQEI